MHLRRSVAVSALLLSLAPVSGAAQTTVRTVGPEGQPIGDVQVEWWAPGEMLGAVLTGPDGVAEAPPADWAAAVRLHFRHVATEARIVQMRDLPQDGTIRLEPKAIPIAGLAVEVGDWCSEAGNPDARHEWSTVAARYSSDTGFRAKSARFRRSKDRVRAEELGFGGGVDGQAVNFADSGGGVIHGDDRTFRPLAERARVDGYAWRPFFNTVSIRSFEWSYPELDRRHAYHFASPSFGELHDFRIVREDGDAVTLAFCGSRGRDRPILNGVLELIRGERFVAAEWRFVIPGASDRAGGFATFGSVTDSFGDAPHLVATEGAFYRESSEGADRYVIERTLDAEWRVLRDEDHPCTGGLSIFPAVPGEAEAGAFATCLWRNW